jgi:hypothetical protein
LDKRAQLAHSRQQVVAALGVGLQSGLAPLPAAITLSIKDLRRKAIMIDDFEKAIILGWQLPITQQ